MKFYRRLFALNLDFINLFEMHRISLRLEQLSIFWDRSKPECFLFEQTLNTTNVRETENFLLILDQEAIKYKKDSYEWALKTYEKLRQKLMKEPPECEISEAMIDLTKIILRAPSDSATYFCALRLRGQMFVNNRKIKRAVNDFEMCLSLPQTQLSFEDLCEINGYLTVCTYTIGLLNKASMYYQKYLQYKDQLPLLIQHLDSLVQLENTIKNFRHEIIDPINMSPEISKVKQCTIPFRGFNSSIEIPLSSAACYVGDTKNYNTESKAKGVFTYDDIPEESIVFVEHSFEIGVHTPLVQCEYCLHRYDAMYTCQQCRYKTYCCLDCMEKDKSSHAAECTGYMNATLLILDAVSLFRMLIRVMSTLKATLFQQRKFEEAVSAYYIMSVLPSEIEKKLLHKNRYMSILVSKPLYEKLNDVQYSTLIATAFRLTIFLNRNTYLLENFLENLHHMPNKEKLILVGSILMRIQCHILLNTFDFEYILSLENDVLLNSFEEVKPFSEKIDDINEFYNINEEQDLDVYFKMLSFAPEKISSSELPQIRHSSLCHPIQRLLSTYTDKIVEMCSAENSEDFLLFTEGATVPTTELTASMMNQAFVVMAEEERYSFMETFAKNFHKHFVDYFIGLVKCNNYIPQVISSLCTTLSKFRHSCEPNVEVMLLEDGFIIGKALRRIEKWEEIVVSYKANHFIHSHNERCKYLYRINILCECNRCQTPKENEEINLRCGVYCHKCNQEITPAMSQCPKCSTYHTKELLRYRKEIKLIEKEIECETDERKLYLLHLTLYILGRKNFTPCHEICINMELKYTKFLALKNADEQAYKVLMEAKDKILNVYEKNEIWFSFFGDILSIIEIMLTNNINKKLHSLSLDGLRNICEIGLQIAKGQQNYVRFYETFDYHCKTLVPAFRKFLAWKEELICWNLHPIVKKLELLKMDVNNCEEDLPELISEY